MFYRLALAQINPTVGDFEGNTRKIVEYIDRARGVGADLVGFPELALCGYPPEDLLFKPSFLKANLRTLEKVIKATKNISAIVGLVHPMRRNVYNGAAVIHNRKLITVYHKIHLSNYGVFDEKRYFQPGNIIPLFQTGKITLAVNICEEIWLAAGPTARQVRAGGQLVINISSSPYHEGKLTERQRILKDRAKENRIFLAYVNTVGGQDELVFDGGSMVFNPAGKLIAGGKQFCEDLIIADIPYPPSADIAKSGDEDNSIRLFNLRLLPKKRTKVVFTAAPPVKLSLEEEIYSALVLGTRDYLVKNGFQKAVIGLSGGLDSALVTAIAVDALGKDNVVGVTMPSMYSSPETQNDAEIVARNLGIELLKIPISGIFSAYLHQLREYFTCPPLEGSFPLGRRVGKEPDVTEENIQARIRGTLLMALSNKFGWLVLATGNKSEVSVGYCTLYGDMVGGFAVIKDIPKTMVYKLVRYYNRQAGREVIPRSIIKRAPSAELRPNQKDVDSIPPYELLDPIVQQYIEENKSVEEIVKSGFPRKVVEKVAALVDANEYKRRQSPIGIKITRRGFGKDRRMPITNRFN